MVTHSHKKEAAFIVALNREFSGKLVPLPLKRKKEKNVSRLANPKKQNSKMFMRTMPG